MADLVVTWYRFFRRRRTLLLLIAGAVFLFCFIASFFLSVREDVQALIPKGSSVLAERFAYVQLVPFFNVLTVTVGNGPEPPEKLADALADALRNPEIPKVQTGPGASFSPAGLARLCSHAPALLGADGVAEVEALLGAESIRESLRHNVRTILSPAGLGLRDLVGMDPLRVHSVLFKRLASLSSPGGFSTRNGHFIDETGNYSLVLAEPAASMTDASASSAIMQRARQAVDALPQGTEAYITGSYGHSEANALVIKGDLQRVLPVSLLLLSALFLVFLRRWKALGMVAVPLGAVSVAAMVTAIVHQGALSGIVLGFGSVLLGITADYAIHTYYALNAARSTEEGLAALTRPLFAAAGTTSAAFAGLFLSSIPAIRQMALFGLAGIATALFTAVLVLPQLFNRFGTGLGANLGVSKQDARTAFSPSGLPTVAPAALFCLVIAWSFCTLRFDGDIRSLSYVSPKLQKTEEQVRSIWKIGKDRSFVVAVGDGSEAGLEKALAMNEAVLSVLFEAEVSPSSLAPLLPSRESQRKSLEAWKSLWRKRGPEVLAALTSAAGEAGFSPRAFKPFEDWIAAEPSYVDQESIRALGAGVFLDMFLRRTAVYSLVYTMLPEGFTPDADLQRKLEATGAYVISGAAFRHDMAEAVGADIFKFCLAALTTTVLAVFLLFRTPLRCVAVLMPMLASTAFTLAMFKFCGIAMNMFHAVALPLVITLSVDYGIFMQTVLEGRLEASGKKAVLLSALTTLAGFGSLLLADHPALYSLGLTVTGGVPAALAAAVWLLPLLRGGKGRRAQ